MVRTKYLIIEDLAGGIGAAEVIHRVDKGDPITIVSNEPYPAYYRPLIAKYLTKESSEEKMLFRPIDFYSRSNIACLLGKKVKCLGLSCCTAEFSNGEKVTWEKLLLASGGMPIVPEIEGISKGGVFTSATLDDPKAINSFLESISKVIVTGGGRPEYNEEAADVLVSSLCSEWQPEGQN